MFCKVLLIVVAVCFFIYGFLLRDISFITEKGNSSFRGGTQFFLEFRKRGYNFIIDFESLQLCQSFVNVVKAAFVGSIKTLNNC